MLKLLGMDNILGWTTSWQGQGAKSGEVKPMLVGGGRDGTMVNVGGQCGLKGQVQYALPWLFVLGSAHHLELACKDAFPAPCSPV